MRRIASHYLLSDGVLLKHPLVTLSDDGRVLEIETCADIDRLPRVEFHSGILMPFEQGLVLLTGVDGRTLQLTDRAALRRL